MIPAPFDYVAPSSVDEAVQTLSQAIADGRDVKVIAGGQSLLPVLRMRLAAPELLVDLGRIGDLTDLRDDGDAIVIGAMATHDTVLRHELVRQHALLLALATETVADPQVRHRGTLGGARREVAAQDFFEDLFSTAVGEGELLVQVRVPKFTGWGAHYEKFNRISHAWSMVGVAAAVRVEGGTIAEARVGLTNMGSVPVRARAVEDALVGVAVDGSESTSEAVRAACAQAGDGTSPPPDPNADADYRRHLAGVLTGRAVLAAAGA
jgi:carbon-monoxide dehydrogenase medium subunit